MSHAHTVATSAFYSSAVIHALLTDRPSSVTFSGTVPVFYVHAFDKPQLPTSHRGDHVFHVSRGNFLISGILVHHCYSMYVHRRVLMTSRRAAVEDRPTDVWHVRHFSRSECLTCHRTDIEPHVAIMGWRSANCAQDNRLTITNFPLRKFVSGALVSSEHAEFALDAIALKANSSTPSHVFRITQPVDKRCCEIQTANSVSVLNKTRPLQSSTSISCSSCCRLDLSPSKTAQHAREEETVSHTIARRNLGLRKMRQFQTSILVWPYIPHHSLSLP